MFDGDVISDAANAMLFERARVLVPGDDQARLEIEAGLPL